MKLYCTRYSTPTEFSAFARLLLASALYVSLAGARLVAEDPVSWWDLGGHFVPLYTVEWRNAGTRKSAAIVELVGPERSLKKLWVEKPQYVRREPPVVPDREKLLLQTNVLNETNARANP